MLFALFPIYILQEQVLLPKPWYLYFLLASSKDCQHQDYCPITKYLVTAPYYTFCSKSIARSLKLYWQLRESYISFLAEIRNIFWKSEEGCDNCSRKETEPNERRTKQL